MANKPRAAPFKATRMHHSAEAAEDYTELIDDLIREQGQARIKDIALHLGISHVTALRTVERLKNEGFLDTSPRQPVTLTAKGRKVAEETRKRHRVLVEFFVSLGVPKDVAEIDVEGAEHHISKITLACIENYLETQK